MLEWIAEMPFPEMGADEVGAGDQEFLLNFQVQKSNLRFLSMPFQLRELRVLSREKGKGRKAGGASSSQGAWENVAEAGLLFRSSSSAQL